MENQNPNNQLQIELKEEVAQGTYANLAIITHSSSEFILDFVCRVKSKVTCLFHQFQILKEKHNTIDKH